MSSAITVQCSHCSARLTLKSSASVGKRVKCPKCQQAFVVEAPLADDFAAADDPFSGIGGEIPMAVVGGGKTTARKGVKGKKKKGKKRSSAGGWQKPAIIASAAVLGVGAVGTLVWAIINFMPGDAGGTARDGTNSPATQPVTPTSGSEGPGIASASEAPGAGSHAGGPPTMGAAAAAPSSAGNNSLPQHELDISGTAVFDAMPPYPGAELSRAYVDDRGWGRRTYRCAGNESEEEVRANYERILVEDGWEVEVKPNELFRNTIDITAIKENLTVVVTVDTSNTEGVGIFFVTRVNEGDGVPSPSGLPGIALTLPNGREPDMEGTRVLDDVPPYPGATLFNAFVFDDSVNRFAIRVYTTPDSLETIGKYYWRVLVEAGWTIQDVIPQDNSRLGKGGHRIQAFIGNQTLSVLAYTDEDANTNKIEFTAHLSN